AAKIKMFAAHSEILHDEELVEEIENTIMEQSKKTDYAVMEVYEEFINIIKKAKDELIAARAADFCDVRDRLLQVLQGDKRKDLSHMECPVIIVAHDLLPSDTATLDRVNVLGIITELGSATSHTAIIANSYRIPAISGVDNCTNILQDAKCVGVDALLGEVYIEPDTITLNILEEKKSDYQRKLLDEEKYLDKPLQTLDGIQLQIGLNIGGVEDLTVYGYSDFIGLFRTEFLYMANDHMPTEEEQFTAYSTVLKRAAGKPVTLRTLDIGGDKSLPYLPLPKEENPFLGNRALRLCLLKPDIFRTQLRAALRASAFGELWLMLPMVGSIDDIRRARAVYDDVKVQLEKEGVPIGKNVKFGIMIEIPAIAVIADLVAPLVDFASVGTNDLCQYLCAVDRMEAEVIDYYQPLSPAMIRILSGISEAFHAHGKPVSVCGELAGSKHGALLLAGLGYEKLSMSESNMTGVKWAMAKVTMIQLQNAVKEAGNMLTQSDVISLFNAILG
ncbi:MAG TPA: phosphoenolpyruvate--protein phosphotransferase, partial [Clostridiales bacterium]|nr:phosphoenolpyruvate--protein phosphotransferase [Clostridiales bacterium]